MAANSEQDLEGDQNMENPLADAEKEVVTEQVHAWLELAKGTYANS